MPLFRSKFHPKKAPPRKKNVVSNIRREMDPQQLEKEFDIKIERVRLDLGYAQIFELQPHEHPPKWISLNQEQTKKKSSSEMTKLEGENNLLKLQVETLLDMLTETTIEAHLNSAGAIGENSTKQKRNVFRGKKLF